MTPEITLLALLCGGLLGVLVTALVVYPASHWVTGRCTCYPLDRIRCARMDGHIGAHSVRPADVRRDYERRPF